jgi:hypothetical protein
MDPWLRRLKHDLVKRAVWPARDLRDCGQTDLDALRRGLRDLRDDSGAPVDAEALWARLRAQAPGVPARALDAFGEALAGASRAVAAGEFRDALVAVLGIESAFDELARTVDEERTEAAGSPRRRVERKGRSRR